MKIAIILGSIREARQSHKIALYLEQKMRGDPFLEVELLDLAEHDLPMLANKWKDQANKDPRLEQFGKSLIDADGLILCSPEYHGSYTGVLKNALDHYWKEFQDKPMGVVVTGSGRMGGINASTQMQLLILSLGAFPMPTKLLVPFVDHAFDKDGVPIEGALEQQVDRFIQSFKRFAHAISQMKAESPV